MESAMLKAFRYRLYPTATQETALDTTLLLCQRLYKGALEERKGAYRKAGRTLTAYDQRRLGPELPVPDGEFCENALNVKFRLHSVLAAPFNSRRSPCPNAF